MYAISDDKVGKQTPKQIYLHQIEIQRTNFGNF